MDKGRSEAQLKAASKARVKLITTDGVFSMDGHIAPLKDICDLADKYGAVRFIVLRESSCLVFCCLFVYMCARSVESSFL